MNGYNSQNTKQELEEIIRNYQNVVRDLMIRMKLKIYL